ncbi:MAG: hypothetical protein U5K43_00835 [Halofilum sp. (in: g-proteobacteria)]|nr:hypothetical protein [Halofilum sp. (in: g-proteobacteria)]
MSVRLHIENPPPFKQARRRAHSDAEARLVEGSMAEGEDVVRHYLAAGLRLTGFHHSDLDPFETSEIRGNVSADRFDTFEYARFLKTRLGQEYRGTLVPHHIGVYAPASDQVAEMEALGRHGVDSVVVVGKPHSDPPGNASYKATVEDVLAEMAASPGTRACEPGAIGIHLRPDEPERIARKFEAAGGQRLRLMGQFLDEADSLVEFLGRLAATFESRGLDLDGLEYNVGLAIFGLRNRRFYARLLRKEALACEARFAGLRSRQQRLDESVRMNLEFAERAIEAGRRHGIDVGFSIQPLIEYLPTGRIHPAVDATVELAQQLEQRYATKVTEEAPRATGS